MLLSLDMAAAFGDWLEREEIQHALVSARPELSGRLELDEDRPLLRVPLGDGRRALVAKIADRSAPHWAVGIPHPQAPTLRETNSLEDVVDQVLAVLEAAESPDAWTT